jgi:hypothetical protein
MFNYGQIRPTMVNYGHPPLQSTTCVTGASQCDSKPGTLRYITCCKRHNVTSAVADATIAHYCSHTHKHAHTYTHSNMHTNTYLHMQPPTYTHQHMQHMHACTHVCTVHRYAHISVFINTHACFTHTYMHTHL